MSVKFLIDTNKVLIMDQKVSQFLEVIFRSKNSIFSCKLDCNISLLMLIVASINHNILT